MSVERFVLSHLPPRGSRVLEVGCGHGRLARAIADTGHRVVAIDPDAPEGEIFRRVTLEALGDEEPFDAVVASRSLHHIHDLRGAVDRIAELLRPAGIVVVNEHAFDQVDERTARWYASRSSDPAVPRSPERFRRWWAGEHAGLHGFDDLRPELERWFAERFFAWVPYLHEELGIERSEELELIEAGEIRATGFRFVGRLRPKPQSTG